jgi:HK97 family phage major capsid protein
MHGAEPQFLRAIRKLKDTTGQPVTGLGNRGQLLGYPSYLDPFVPAIALSAKSILFGDFSKYFVRVVNGIHFERSDDFKFQNDLVAFRCILRLDAALIDLVILSSSTVKLNTTRGLPPATQTAPGCPLR